MIIFLKLVAVGLALISIIKSYLDFRKKREPLIVFMIWVLLWIGAITLVVFPQLIDQVALYTKDTTVTIGSLTSVAFIFLLYLIYRVYTKAARIEFQQTQLIRKLGLNKSDVNEKQ